MAEDDDVGVLNVRGGQLVLNARGTLGLHFALVTHLLGCLLNLLCHDVGVCNSSCAGCYCQDFHPVFLLPPKDIT